MRLLLAHLSDAHIGPLPRPRMRELFGKRLTGYLNWRKRNTIHNMEVLAALVDDLRAQNPDHVAMTGDILNIGLPSEFPFAVDFLKTLGAAQDVSFVPGNHDAYVRSSVPLVAQAFAPWTSSDEARPAAYPYLRMRGGMALVGVSSAIPTAPLLASGAVGKTQRRATGQLLDALTHDGFPRVVMIHHPPWQGGATPGRGLRDAGAFERVLGEHGADLVLHGHNHRTSVHHLSQTQGRPIPVVGVASASAVPGTPRHRAAYHLYDLSVDAGVLRIEARMRGLLPGTRTIGDLGPLAL